MAGKNSTKHKHLTFEDRKEIMECLDKNVSFKAIGRRIGKDPTTISKEVKKHVDVREPVTTSTTKSDGTPVGERPCPLLMKAPFVCNPCEKRRRYCPYQKQFYVAKKAHAEYEALRTESREGIALTKDEFWEGDATITQGIKKGQRLYHIMETGNVGFSKSTAYRNLHRGYLSIAKTDLPRVPKFKPRKQQRPDSVPKAAKVGRMYVDFRAHIEENDIKYWVEMDTVIGRIGGKVIMTFDFTVCNFMFGLLLDNKTADEAALKIRNLKRRMKNGGVLFGEKIPLLLTDNGGEFANISAFENNLDGTPETKLYFCDPYRSCQKPRVEKTHSIFRDIVPKGESFDDFTQDTVNLIFSHINSQKRKSLNGKTPFEMLSFLCGEDFLALLGISEIPATEVIQTDLLLKKIRKAPANTASIVLP